MRKLSTVPEEPSLLDTKSSNLRPCLLHSSLIKNKFDTSEGSCSPQLSNSTILPSTSYTGMRITQSWTTTSLSPTVKPFNSFTSTVALLRSSRCRNIPAKLLLSNFFFQLQCCSWKKKLSNLGNWLRVKELFDIEKGKDYFKVLRYTLYQHCSARLLDVRN